MRAEVYISCSTRPFSPKGSPDAQSSICETSPPSQGLAVTLHLLSYNVLTAYSLPRNILIEQRTTSAGYFRYNCITYLYISIFFFDSVDSLSLLLCLSTRIFPQMFMSSLFLKKKKNIEVLKSKYNAFCILACISKKNAYL